MSDQYVKDYVLSSIASFVNDPADTDFQHGYLAALECVAREALGIVNAMGVATKLAEQRRRPNLRVVPNAGRS